MILYSSIDCALISASLATYVLFHSLYKSQKSNFVITPCWLSTEFCSLL